MSHKRLFSRALAAAPGRLHFAAHSHHLWPDVSFEGQTAAWEDAATLADAKWGRVMGEIWPAAQAYVAAELKLPDPATIAFAPNTHELLLRIVSALPRRPLRILASDGEFHSFRRQSLRWEESGAARVDRLPLGAIADAAEQGGHDLVFLSHVQFNSGRIFENLERLADLARPEGPWVVIDGYHGFMAVETDLSALRDRLFYLAGGYKYAMAGEGAAFLHAPPGFGPRPEITGWYAEFDALAARPGQIGYAPDARRFLGSTFDPSGLYRFAAVQQMLKREALSTARINAHVTARQDELLAGLATTPLVEAELLNPATPAGRARFLAFRSPSAALWQGWLAGRNVITDVRGDVLRIGFGLYHEAQDVDELLGHLRQLPRSAG